MVIARLTVYLLLFTEGSLLLSTTTYPIRVGVHIHPQHASYEELALAVRQTEELGVDSIWTWDHFFPPHGDPQGNHFEGWTLLAAMAVLTGRARIGCLVTCNSYRNPALLSDMAKTVDHISGGRLIFGLGAGWFERDYQEYGYPFEAAGKRMAALEEALGIIKHRWEVDVPRPVQKPYPPILIGGNGERKTLRLAAQHADMWHGIGDGAALAHKMEVLDGWCKEIGRDPRAIERTTSTNASDTFEERDSFVKAGVTHLILGMDSPRDLEAVERLIHWRNSRQA